MEIKSLMLADDAESGRWFKYDDDGDVEFLIASNATKAYRATLYKEVNKMPPQKRKNPKHVDQVVTQITSKLVLKDWKGEMTNGGKKFPPTEENRFLLLDQAPDFREWVISMAQDLGNFASEGEAAETAALKSEA